MADTMPIGRAPEGGLVWWPWKRARKRPPGVPENAPPELVEAAVRGDPAAMFELGRIFASVPDPEAQARSHEYLKLSATAGYPPAAYVYGRSLEAERGFLRLTEWRSISLSTAATRVPRCVVDAEPWYRLAANAGIPDAQLRMGDLYATGAGVEWDLTQARQWFERAARQGSREAMTRIAALG